MNNSFVDTSTIRVNVKNTQSDTVREDYSLVDNIINVKNDSRIYLIQEVNDERYRIMFGDGIIGKKLENNNYITASYITTSGEDGKWDLLISSSVVYYLPMVMKIHSNYNWNIFNINKYGV